MAWGCTPRAQLPISAPGSRGETSREPPPGGSPDVCWVPWARGRLDLLSTSAEALWSAPARAFHGGVEIRAAPQCRLPPHYPSGSWYYVQEAMLRKT